MILIVLGLMEQEGKGAKACRGTGEKAKQQTEDCRYQAGFRFR